MPTIEAPSNTPTVVGWSTASGTHTASYTSGQTNVSLTSSGTLNLYAQTTKAKVTLTATFNYNSNTNSGSFTNSSENKTCDLAATYNGTAQSTSCSVDVVGRSSVGKYNSAYAGYSTGFNMTSAIGKDDTTKTISANTTYYAIYSSGVTIYYPKTTTTRDSYSYYRNEYYSSASATTAVINSTNTATGNFTFSSSVSGYDLYGFHTAASANTQTYASVSALAGSGTTTAYAILYKSVTPTFYYSSASDGTKASIQGTAANQYIRCTSSAAEVSNTDFTVPTLSPAEVAPFGTGSVGWQSSASTIGSTTPNTSSASWYKSYRVALAIYYPNTSNGVSSTSSALYRNSYYGTGTKYTPVTATSNTGTTQATSVTLSSLKGKLSGITSTVNSTTPYAVNNSSQVVSSSSTIYYAVTAGSENVTFHYNSSSTIGTFTDATTTISLTSIYYCSSSSAMGTSHGTTTSVPSVVSSSKGKYGSNDSIEFRNNYGYTILPTTTFVAGQTYYPMYGESITYHIPLTTTTSSSSVFPRYEYYDSSSTMKAEVYPMSTMTIIDGYNFYGYATSYGTNSVTYATDNDLANSTTTEVYILLYKSVTPTFYYYNGSAQASVNGTAANQYIRCTSSAAEISNSSFSVPTTVSNSTGVKGEAYAGVSASSGSTTAATLNTATSTYYAYYTGNVNDTVTATFYYNSGTGNGTLTVATKQASGTQVNNYTSTTNGTTYSATKNSKVSDGAITVPTEVSGSKGRYGSTYAGVSAGFNMTAATVNTVTTTYYAFYSKSVDIYYPKTATTRDKYSYYRNEYFTSASAMTSVINSTNTATGNFTFSSSVSGYDLYGFHTAASANTQTYASVSALAGSGTTTAYAILYKSVTPTFYYSSASDGTKASIQGTAANQYIRCTSSAAEVSNTDFTVPTLSPAEVAPFGTGSVGWQSSASTIGSTTPNTSSASWYKSYRVALAIYYPNTSNGVSSTSSALYRNSYYGTGTKYTPVTATSNTGTTQATSVTLSSLKGTFNGITSTVNSTTSYAVNNSSQVVSSSSTIYYAVTTASEDATFHYNSNTVSGSFNDATATSSVTSTYYCGSTSSMYTDHGTTTSVPNAVSSSVGKYNSAYKGISSSSTTITTATEFKGGSSYYAYYSNNSQITIYYPKTSTTRDTYLFYRNEFYSSSTEMKAVINTQQTSTTSYSISSSVSGYYVYGLATEASTNTKSYNYLSNLAESDITTAYAILYKSVTPKFYYSSSNTGTRSYVQGNNANSYIRCTASAAETIETNFTIPSLNPIEVTPYGTSSVGWSSSSSSISSETPNTSSANWYKSYQASVTNYYPNSTSTVTSQTLYRNSIGNDSTYTTVLSDSSSGTSNFTPYTQSIYDGYDPYITLCTAVSGGGTCDKISDAAKTSTTIFYQKAYYLPTLKFYYNSNSTSGSTTIKNTSAQGAIYLWPVSTTTAGFSGSINIPSTVSNSVGTYNNQYAGLASTTGTMNTGDYPYAGVTYYAVYSSAGSSTSDDVTNYYYNGSSYTSRTLYRNQWFTSTSAMSDSVLSTSATGTSNYTTSTGPGSSAWSGLSTAQDTTAEYATVSAAANSSSKTLYTIYQFNVNYAKGSNVSGIGASTGSCKVTTSSTSCSVVLPTITPNSGYASVGWNTTSGATSGTAVGASYSLSTSGITLYANAVAVWAENLSYTNNSSLTNASGTACTDAQCALDAIARILHNAGAY